MQRLVEQGARDVKVREKALEIFRRAGVRGHDFLGEVRAAFEHVRDRVRYTRDPAGVEWLQGPRYTLEHGLGDCDDKAVALAALLKATGNPARLKFRAIGTPGLGGFSHVYVMARLGPREIALDPTWPRTPLGWQFPRPTMVGEFAL